MLCHLNTGEGKRRNLMGAKRELHVELFDLGNKNITTTSQTIVNMNPRTPASLDS